MAVSALYPVADRFNRCYGSTANADQLNDVMVDKEDSNALVKRADGELSVTKKTSSLMSRMTNDWLVASRSLRDVDTDKRFRIGEYEFRRPDYEQIARWASDLKLTLEVVIKRLEGCSCDDADVPFEFSVTDGHIRSLVLDANELPISVLDWVDGLEITNLAISDWTSGGTLHAPTKLMVLEFTYCNFSAINLSNLTGLTSLRCSHNQLTELDLSNVPKLTSLDCSDNQLTELDLSSVPELSLLDCRENDLTELDLSYVPKLTSLDCAANQLTELDLSSVPELSLLECSWNQLRKLDLSSVPELSLLDCCGNQLTELDLSNVPKLTSLDCSDNQLTELDLSSVPQLSLLDCWRNQLTELDLSNVPELTSLRCSHNQLTELDLSNVPKCQRRFKTDPDLMAADQ